MSVTNKTLQLKRKGGFATVEAAKTAIETAFAGGTLADGEPILGVLTNGEVVLGINTTASGSVFYNAATVDDLISNLESDLQDEIGDLTSLNTDVKTSLVAAINSLKAANIAYDGTGKSIVSGSTDVDAAIGALDTAVANIQAGNAEYTIISADTASLGANVKEAYQLQKTVGGVPEVVGETIKIYKDSSLHSAYLGHVDDTVNENTGVVTPGSGDTALCFVYLQDTGLYTLVAINVESYLSENEFSAGLQVDNHVVSVKLDDTEGSDSAKFLYMKEISGENSAIALSGITTEIASQISTAIEDIDASESGSTTHITVGVTQVDGEITTVTVAEDDIASASALTAETTARKSVTGINSDTYVANSGTIISGATSMNNADVILAGKVAELEAAKVSVVKAQDSEDFLTVTPNADNTEYSIKIDGVQDAITSAIEALDTEDTAVENQFVTSVSQADGVLTISRAQVAASGVTANAITGDTTHAAVAGTNVASQIDSISQTLKSQGDAALTGVTSGNGAIAVGDKTNNAQSISLVVNNTGASADLLSVDSSNGLTISNIYDCGTW